ncbi:hypothetical protein [Dactylosporangium sp. NPDC049140]|uniref:hypothetical protein n=1 Tax=Dactylosporangium sp. NPDC049140 TaxID=3155647 RepID=UPI0033F6E7A0
MEQDLHTLLTSVRDDAPPPRLSVDDITAAGRHLVRRRRRMALLSSVAGGTVTAIAAVTAALMLTGTPRALTPAVDPSALPSASPALTEFAEAPAFVTTYQGYKAGPYIVSAPDLVTNAYQQSSIDPGPGPEPTEPAQPAQPLATAKPSASRASEVSSGGTLVVYRPGAFEPALFEKGGEKIQVGDGDVGFLAYSGGPTGPSIPPGAAKAMYGRDALVPTLAWQYTDGAWAAIYWTAWENVPGRDELLTIADGLAPSAPRQFPVAFQAATVPRGYQLLTASYGDDVPSDEPAASAVRLTLKPPPLPLYEPYNFDDLTTLTLATGRSYAGSKMAGRLDCSGQVRCTRILGNGDVFVSGEVTNSKPSAALTQITLGIKPMDPDEPGAWLPAVKVFSSQ